MAKVEVGLELGDKTLDVSALALSHDDAFTFHAVVLTDVGYEGGES